MKVEDIKELSNHLNFCELAQFSKVVSYGELGDTYYIIIKGVCTVQIPNPGIDDWAR